MARPMNKPKKTPLAVVIWANIFKWQAIRGVTDSEIAALLGLQRLDARKREYYITATEMERICGYLAIEPTKLFEC